MKDSVSHQTNAGSDCFTELCMCTQLKAAVDVMNYNDFYLQDASLLQHAIKIWGGGNSTV